MMRRILLLVTVALVMAAMMVAMALPAMAAPRAPQHACLKITVKAIEIGLLLPAIEKACR